MEVKKTKLLRAVIIERSNINFYFSKVEEIPSLLEMFSYIFYFSSSIIGPSFEFSLFRKFIRLEAPYNKIPIKYAIKAGLKEFLKGVILFVLLNTFGKWTDVLYCGTEEYSNKSLMYKFSYLNFADIFMRYKYYFVWKISQTSVILCGLSYNPKNDKNGVIHNFDKIECTSVRKIELVNNIKDYAKNWNITVHIWLKYNVMLRLTNLENNFIRNNSHLITFIFSALWHGFHPSYYIFFFSCFLMDQIDSMLEKEIENFSHVKNKNLFSKIVSIYLVHFFFSYNGTIFELLEFNVLFRFAKSLYFIPHVVVIVLYFLLTIKRILRKSK